MTHYAHFKQSDPRALKALAEVFSFATIAVSDKQGQVHMAYAPVTFKQGITPNGTLEFHLAKANPIVPLLADGAQVTFSLQGPHCHISPSWYQGRFPEATSDRSQTAPTYNYLHATVTGALKPMSTAQLDGQLQDLVSQEEAGIQRPWAFGEINQSMYQQWREKIIGFSVPVSSCDITAKLSQEQTPEDRVGVIKGLRTRGNPNDALMATLIERYDGTPESLIACLKGLKGANPQSPSR